MDRAALQRELELINRKNRWTDADRKRANEIKAMLRDDGPLPEPKSRTIPHEQTLEYSLQRIREEFGKK